MSLRRKTNNRYNRALEKDTLDSYYNKLDGYDDYWSDEECYVPFWRARRNWWDDDMEIDWGCPKSMLEYHGMHVMTLLRGLNIKTATEELYAKGWN